MLYRLTICYTGSLYAIQAHYMSNSSIGFLFGTVCSLYAIQGHYMLYMLTICYIGSPSYMCLIGEADDPILSDPRFKKLQDLDSFERRYQKVGLNSC